MIKYNNSNINDWYFYTSDIMKVYRNNVVIYYKVSTSGGTPTFDVCYAVVDDISQYSDREFVDVFNLADSKWYKLNNLNQYEEYGKYGSGRNITYYDGKLTIDDGYEYMYSGGSWVNVGEVSGSTATLPDVPFVLNYNAKNYDASTHTIAQTDGQLNGNDAVAYNNPSNIVDHSADGYITISNSSMRIRKTGQDISLFNRTNTSTGAALTIICKAKSTGGNNIITNRDSNYNWMYRLKTSGTLTFHGTSETGSINWNTSNPDIMSVRTYYDSGTKLYYNNWTQNTSTSPISFTYGSTNTDSGTAGALFVGYGWSQTSEQWSGDFYWVYMAQYQLTDAQIQEVIAYNEGGGSSEYPIYYDEKADPLDNLTFSSMTEATEYAYNNCVYDGMKATIAGERYYFDTEDENGWVKILSYYKVEDVTTSSQGGSGWTITGSVSYNPNSSYYDDFSVETNSTSTSYKIAKVTIFGYDNFTYYLRANNNYSYSYGYVMSTNIDELSSDPTSMLYTDARAITNTYGRYMSTISPVNLYNYRRVTYNNLDKTVEHTFYVIFCGRTYSNYQGNATILIPKEQDNENWEQVTFSSSTNVSGSTKALYIDNSNSSGGTNNFYNRWIIGLPAGSHSSYTNYSNYNYCPNVTSSTFTSVAGEQRQVNFTYNSTTNKTLQFRLVDTSGNTLSPSDTVYYNMTYTNSCNASAGSSNVTFPSSQIVKVGGRFSFASSSNRHYIYGYSPNISLNTGYYVDNYTTYFDITYTKLNTEAVTVTYTTYDPNDVEIPAFNTDISWPYGNSGTSFTTLTSYEVPYTYSYSVKQTSNLFNSSTYDYTAGQASRTISFTLYPDNREFSTVADMEAYAYAWEGMNASVNGTKYQYKNGSWAEKTFNQYEYIRTQNVATAYYSFNTNFYPTTANTFEVKVEFVDRSIDWGAIILWRPGGSSNFEFDTVTSGYQAIVRTGGNNGVTYRPTIGANNPTVYTLPLSAQSGTYSVNGGATQTIQYNYTQMALPASRPMGILGDAVGKDLKGAVVKLYYIKVFDGNGNLVKHYVPSDNNGTPCIYEIVNGDYIMNTYSGTNPGTVTLGPAI